MHVADIEVVRLVQHEVGGHQAQHGRDLPPAVVQYVLENGLYRPISYRQKQT